MNESPSPPTRNAFRQDRTAASSPAGSEDAKRRRGSWIIWIWFWLTMGLVAIVQIPQEITAWKYAAALEARESGDKQLGYRLLEEAIQRNTDKRWYEEKRYRWLTEDEHYAEALEVLESFQGTSVEYRREKSQLLLHLRRFREAIQLCETIRDESVATGVPKQPQALNELAYARALGKIDFPQAAADMDTAVATTMAERDDAIATLKAMPWVALWSNEAAQWESLLIAVLDTRGFVRYQMGEAESAEVDLDRAVKMVEPAISSLLHDKADIAKSSRYARDVERRLADDRRFLAVLIYHRGLNRQKLGREADAKQDFDRVRELIGKEPDETLF